MKILTKVLVGSRLHGLSTPESDYDYRGVHINPLKDILSPYKKTKDTSWLEGKTDDTSYELANFCKFATQGNATILEVFFSDIVFNTTPQAEEMRENWKKFMDTDRFVAASRGYASNQLNKMELLNRGEIPATDRTGKFAVAYCRVMWQCARFLETQKFFCKIDDIEMAKFLRKIKSDFQEEDVPQTIEYFRTLQKRVDAGYAKAKPMKPDTDWIEEFILRTYMEENNVK